MIRKLVFYTGRVQGVGFCYTAANIAKRYEVAGYVMNLDDGRVRLEAQGEADQIDTLLADIASAMAGNITAVDVTDRAFDPKLSDMGGPEAFTVRYAYGSL